MSSPKVVFLPLSEIASKLRQLIKPTRHGFLKSFDDCFSAKEVINVVLAHNYAASLTDAIKLLNKLLEKGFFKNVDPPDGRFSDDSSLFKFEVIHFLFYSSYFRFLFFNCILYTGCISWNKSCWITIHRFGFEQTEHFERWTVKHFKSKSTGCGTQQTI